MQISKTYCNQIQKSYRKCIPRSEKFQKELRYLIVTIRYLTENSWESWNIIKMQKTKSKKEQCLQYWQKIYCNDIEEKKSYRKCFLGSKALKRIKIFNRKLLRKLKIAFGCDYQNCNIYAWIWHNIFFETSRARIFSAN